MYMYVYALAIWYSLLSYIYMNILLLVCVSDLPTCTHYVHVMASCGIAWLLCSSVVL